LAYTIGASHGPFTGNGSFTIAKPNGIRSILSGIPSHTGHDGAVPRRYFRLGRMSLGNPHGFQFSHGLEYVQQLLYPIAPVWEILAYDIKDGASCTFYELVDVPDLTTKQPWDRTPQTQVTSTPFGTSGTLAETVAFTYTVPTGRRLMVSYASAQLIRITAATTTSYSQAKISMGGALVIECILRDPALGKREESILGGGPVYLGPGQTVIGTYASQDVGGSIFGWVGFIGMLFDA